MGIRIGIVGKGALGLLFAGVAKQSPNVESVEFLMDKERMARHANDVYTVNGEVVEFNDVSPDIARSVDLLLVAVKSPALPGAIDMMACMVGENTVLVPLLNGITSEGKIAARYGWDKVVACVSYGMDAARFGTTLEYTKVGQLQIGALPGTPSATVERASSLLEAAGIPFEVKSDIEKRLWLKFMANTGVNQVSAVYEVNYGQLLGDPTGEPFRMYISAMREVMAVARAEGIDLTDQDMNSYVDVIRVLDPASRPSTAQDRVNRNPSEVEEFSGEVIRRGAKYGLYTPCNQFLYDAIKAYEKEYVG